MNALLLVGSPKPQRSASRSFGEAVLSRLEGLGATTRLQRVTPAFRSAGALSGLLEEIAWADLVVLSFPLYVDTLPAPVTRLLETWADAAAADTRSVLVPKRLAVLTQCGFPETHHCAIAVAVCQSFCRDTGVEWAGSLAFGTGGALEGRRIEHSPLARAIPAFDQAAAALVTGHPIPKEAQDMVARRLSPSWVYTWFGGLAWWYVARKRGGREPLRLRRYAS